MVKVMERKVGIIDRLHQLYLDFPCFLVQFMTDKNAKSSMPNVLITPAICYLMN